MFSTHVRDPHTIYILLNFDKHKKPLYKSSLLLCRFLSTYLLYITFSPNEVSKTRQICVKIYHLSNKFWVQSTWNRVAISSSKLTYFTAHWNYSPYSTLIKTFFVLKTAMHLLYSLQFRMGLKWIKGYSRGKKRLSNYRTFYPVECCCVGTFKTIPSITNVIHST